MNKDRPEFAEVIRELKALANPANVAGMARYGINSRNTLGVPIPALRRMARRIGRDHETALRLWDSEIHDARILAGFVADPGQATPALLEKWAADFDSWDVCDQVCSGFFDRTPMARTQALQWSRRREEFVKRAGFVLMAALAVHDKQAEDAVFERFLPAIRREAGDDRNFVKKAVNWALRQIGKRNARLHGQALALARELAGSTSRSARWTGCDAVRELESEAVRRRLKR
jgi:3-methyladenine DNA glycosylase AlkD